MLTGIDWIDVVIVAAAVATALVTLWRVVVKPIIRATNQISEAVPVLMKIAKEFQPNHGTSLVDRLEDQHQSVMDHIMEDRANFAAVKEQLALQDIALRNIQQATIPDPPPPGTPRRRKTDQ